jgi:hypothetical protein
MYRPSTSDSFREKEALPLQRWSPRTHAVGGSRCHHGQVAVSGGPRARGTKNQGICMLAWPGSAPCVPTQARWIVSIVLGTERVVLGGARACTVPRPGGCWSQLARVHSAGTRAGERPSPEYVLPSRSAYPHACTPTDVSCTHGDVGFSHVGDGSRRVPVGGWQPPYAWCTARLPHGPTVGSRARRSRTCFTVGFRRPELAARVGPRVKA